MLMLTNSDEASVGKTYFHKYYNIIVPEKNLLLFQDTGRIAVFQVSHL